MAFYVSKTVCGREGVFACELWCREMATAIFTPALEKINTNFILCVKFIQTFYETFEIPIANSPKIYATNM